MYGDAANKLVVEAKRTQNLDHLSTFQDELVRSVVRETKELSRSTELQNPQEDDHLSQCHTFVAHLAMRRNKRCLLAYERLRAARLDQLAWENQEPEIPNHTEQEYFRNYSDVLIQYKSAFPEIDLSGSLEPPKDVFLDVRVLKDAGEIQTEYGVFNLTKDSQFFVRKADVERLIQQGYLQKI
ncbi:CYFA0S01e14598g1_1 [Cyberlindnera fabianii]|uniref:DNA replication complex GINS protein PSF1 n=1 Tax=Cyberlindnera fabianii TaxID=36022 RepID=A0A061AJD9_CYBFA|nr:CYFA0S01e14598g1_1 [Cyberlindnera fabianii]